MYILTIATHFQYLLGFSKLHEQFYAQKVLKILFFYLKSDIDEKISDEFFCFLFFLVAHMFLKTNGTVRKNGIFDFLWGSIQRCVYGHVHLSSIHWCTVALVHQCIGAPMHWSIGARMHWCINALMHQYTGALVHQRTSAVDRQTCP